VMIFGTVDRADGAQSHVYFRGCQHSFDALWVYFLAPPIGMLAAAEVYVRLRSIRAVHCAKYHHNNKKRCIFRCRFAELQNPKTLGTTE